MAITSDFRSNTNKKNYERYINADYKETNPELIDARDRERNQKRYNDKKYELKQNREVSILTKALDEALAFGKSVGLQVKDILQGEDMFSLDNKFADKFHILMEKYKACADMKKSKIYSHQRNQINSLVSGLNKAARDL
jgi:hemerythrin superfamily protein